MAVWSAVLLVHLPGVTGHRSPIGSRRSRGRLGVVALRAGSAWWRFVAAVRETAQMAFGQPAGPPASPRQIEELLALLG
ncbi:MAG: hypothetical protein ACYCR4_03780, partial [Acidimicrobiales bacterium]